MYLIINGTSGWCYFVYRCGCRLKDKITSLQNNMGQIGPDI